MWAIAEPLIPWTGSITSSIVNHSVLAASSSIVAPYNSSELVPQRYLIVTMFSRSMGLSAGSSSATGFSEALFSAVGRSIGSSSAVGIGAISTADGHAFGSSSVVGVGQSDFSADGLTAGSSTAVGFGIAGFQTVGSAIGSSSAEAASQYMYAVNGEAFGSSSAEGFSSAVSDAVGSSAGSSTATGYAQFNYPAIGSSAGSSSAAGVGTSLYGAVGQSVGSSSMIGVGAYAVAAVGSASGSSTATGFAQNGVSAIGSATGSSTAVGVSEAIKQSVGESVGSSTATAYGLAVVSAVGSATGSSTAVGVAPTVTDEIAALSPVAHWVAELDVATSGSDATSWTSQTGSFELYAASGSRPTYGVDDYGPYIGFADDNPLINTSSLLTQFTGTAMTVVIAATDTNTDGSSNRVFYMEDAVRQRYKLDAPAGVDGAPYSEFTVDQGGADRTVTFDCNTNDVFVGRRSGSETWGRSIVESDIVGGGPSGGFTFTTMSLGKNCRIREVAIWNTKVLDSNVNKVVSYLTGTRPSVTFAGVTGSSAGASTAAATGIEPGVGSSAGSSTASGVGTYAGDYIDTLNPTARWIAGEGLQLTGSTVGGWVSTNGQFKLVESNTSVQPTAGSDGSGAYLDFGVTDGMTCDELGSAASGNKSIAIAIAYENITGAGNRLTWFHHSTGSAAQSIITPNASNQFRYIQSSDGGSNNQIQTSYNSSDVAIARYDEEGQALTVLSVNASASSSVAWTLGPKSFDQFDLGYDWPGRLREIIIWIDNPLTGAQESENVLAHLTASWGI